MCFVLIALDSHRDYPLIVAANREEFYNYRQGRRERPAYTDSAIICSTRPGPR